MIETIAGLVMLMTPVSAQAANVPIAYASTINDSADNPITLEEYVREYYSQTPVLAEIAKCESTFRQLSSNGKVIRGKVNRYDVGVMQINELYHDDKASAMGFDLHTLDGNLKYAKWLYDTEGTKPWASSKKCWAGAVASNPTNNQLAVSK